MRVALRGFGFTVGFAVLFVASFASPTLAAPWVEIELNHSLPDHVQNPGGMLEASCWAYPEGTTPEMLVVTIIDPEGTEVFRQEFGAATFEVVQWTVPEGMMDGLYEYRVEYNALGDFSAAGSEIFLVAGLTTGLCAFKFIDYNGNGVYEAELGETLAPGWEICPGGGLSCQETDAGGVTCWFFITPDTYHVCETPQPGYLPTTDECQDITITPDSIEKVEFGNAPSGACCFHPGGTCVETTEADCVASEGVWTGEFTTCDPGLCPPTATERESWGTIKHHYE